MLQFASILLMSFIFRSLAASPIVDIQEQFSELSRSIEPELRDFRTENRDLRGEVIHRMVDALGRVTIEMRNITWDTWEQIESHELANPECLERIREEFDYYVWYGGRDIQSMAYDLDWDLRRDARDRFNPVIRPFQMVNSQAVYRTVQALGRNPFLDNMADTVYELQDQLEYFQNLWELNREQLQQDIANVDKLVERVEYNIEWWHDFTVRWHRVFMGNRLNSVYYECGPENGSKIAGKPYDNIVAKMQELRNRKIV